MVQLIDWQVMTNLNNKKCGGRRMNNKLKDDTQIATFQSFPDEKFQRLL